MNHVHVDDDAIETVMKRIDTFVEWTPIRVKNNTKLTNFVKLIRIKKYNGE